MLRTVPVRKFTREEKFFFYKYFFGGFFLFLSFYIQHYFICRPSDSTVPTDAGIEPRTVATGALTDALTTRLDLIRALG